MIVSTDTELIGQTRVEAKRLIDLEKAIRFALAEIKPVYRWGVTHIWLSFNFIKRPNCRITPEIAIDTKTEIGKEYNPKTLELDLPDCLRQVEERFTTNKRESYNTFSYIDDSFVTKHTKIRKIL